MGKTGSFLSLGLSFGDPSYDPHSLNRKASPKGKTEVKKLKTSAPEPEEQTEQQPDKEEESDGLEILKLP